MYKPGKEIKIKININYYGNMSKLYIVFRLKQKASFKQHNTYKTSTEDEHDTSTQNE